ncbi:MAG: porin family protein [Saprospiraceae bacterium]
MKPFVKILALLLLFTTGTWTLLQAQVGLGLRGGVLWTKAELEQGDDKFDNDYLMGYTGSLFAEIGISEAFAIQPEVVFLQKGYKNTIEDDGIYERKLMMNYLEVPVLAKWRIGSETIKAQLLLGPTFGYALDGTVKANGEKTDLDLDDVTRLDIGVLFGAGFDIPLGPGSVFVDGRYGLGITNLNNAANADDFHWHNRTISVGVGYIYRIGK